MITKSDFISKINELGLSNSTICLHASFKSLGLVDKGPETLIEAFMDTGCTLVCPAFFYQSQTSPIRKNYENNGIDYSTVKEICPVNYLGSDDQIERSMGVIPKLLLKHDMSSRTSHPTNSFVVAGTNRQRLLLGQSELNVYSVYKKIYELKEDAFIMLMGVDFESCTPIHYAEELAGRTLFRRWALSKDIVTEVEEGSCSDGFEKLRCVTRDIEKVASFGEAQVRIYRFKEFIDKLTSTISDNPEVTHCGSITCDRCNDMVSGGRRS